VEANQKCRAKSRMHRARFLSYKEGLLPWAIVLVNKIGQLF